MLPPEPPKHIQRIHEDAEALRAENLRQYKIIYNFQLLLLVLILVLLLTALINVYFEKIPQFVISSTASGILTLLRLAVNRIYRQITMTIRLSEEHLHEIILNELKNKD